MYVDNIGIVSDHALQVHLALNESKEDFEKHRLVLHEIGVLALGRALGFELNVEQIRTIPAVERFGCVRKGVRCFLKRRRVAGWELEAFSDGRPCRSSTLSTASLSDLFIRNLFGPVPRRA